MTGMMAATTGMTEATEEETTGMTGESTEAIGMIVGSEGETMIAETTGEIGSLRRKEAGKARLAGDPSCRAATR